MATKSILKTVYIKDKKATRSLVRALEHASGKASKDVTMNRSYSDASRDEIKKMFGADHDGV